MQGTHSQLAVKVKEESFMSAVSICVLASSLGLICRGRLNGKVVCQRTLMVLALELTSRGWPSMLDDFGPNDGDLLTTNCR